EATGTVDDDGCAIGSGGIFGQGRQAAEIVQHVEVAADVGGIEKRFRAGCGKRAVGLVVLRIIIFRAVRFRRNGRIDDGVVEQEVMGTLDDVGAGGAVAQAVIGQQGIAKDAVKRRIATGSGAVVVNVDIAATII